MNQTNLEWHIAVDLSSMLYLEAVKAVEALGEGWRMPTIQELSSLIDFTKAEPASSSNPTLESMPYWTATPVVSLLLMGVKRRITDAKHWAVDFSRGFSLTRNDQFNYCCVIAVRECETEYQKSDCKIF